MQCVYNYTEAAFSFRPKAAPPPHTYMLTYITFGRVLLCEGGVHCEQQQDGGELGGPHSVMLAENYLPTSLPRRSSAGGVLWHSVLFRTALTRYVSLGRSLTTPINKS